MSLIRKHGAVLQAWACLDLVIKETTAMEQLFLLDLLFMISFLAVCGAVDITLTVNVLPGTRECFIQELTANSQYAIEYQVRVFYSV